MRRVVLCLVVLVIAQGALAQSAGDQSRVQQPKPEVTQQERPADQRGTDQSPLAVKVIPTPKTDAEREEEAKDRREKAETDRKLADYTGELALFTKGLFYATVALGIGTIGLAFFAFIQSRDMKESITVAIRAADIAERNLIEIQRALMTLNKFGLNQLARNGGVIGMRITAEFVNTGNTTAKRYIGSANYVAFDGELAADFTYPDRTAPAPPHGVVGPRVVTPFPIDIAIQDILDIRDSKKWGYIYGWVEYDDIFRNSQRRRTEFCARILVVGNPLEVRDVPRPDAPILAFAMTGPYNATDEDCFYKPGTRPPIGGLPLPTQPPPDNWRQL